MEGTDPNIDQNEEFVLNYDVQPAPEGFEQENDPQFTVDPAENCLTCNAAICICGKSEQIYTPERSLLEDGEIDSPDKTLTDNDDSKLADSYLNKTLDEIKSKPKPLLGKVAAQRRLQAFSAHKRVLEKVSPLLPKSKKSSQLQVSVEPTYDENGDVIDDSLICKPKTSKSVTPKKVSKAVEPSTAWRGRNDRDRQHTYPRFLSERRFTDRFRRYDDRRNWDRRGRSHEGKSGERVDRNMKPKNWDEYKQYLDAYGSYQRKNEPITHKFGMRLIIANSFDDEGYYLNGTFFVAKGTAVPKRRFEDQPSFRQKFYYHETVKRTIRAPHVAYCGNLQNSTNLYPTRHELFEIIPDKRASIMKNFIKAYPNDPEVTPRPPQTKSREWYSKEMLPDETKKKTPPREEEPPSTATSYGLSVLSANYQNQWDGESGSEHENIHDELTPDGTLGDLTPVMEPDTCDEMVDTPEKVDTPEPIETDDLGFEAVEILPIPIKEEIILEMEKSKDSKKNKGKKEEEKKVSKKEDKNNEVKKKKDKGDKKIVNKKIEGKKVEKIEEKQVEVKKVEDKKIEAKQTEEKLDPLDTTPTVQTPNTDEYRSNWEDEEDYLGDIKSPNYEKVWDSDDNNSVLSRKASKKFNRYSNKKDVTIADISYNDKKNLTNGLSDSFINSFGYRRSKSKEEDESPERKRRRLSKKKKKSKRKSKELTPRINLNSLEEELECKQNLLREKRPLYDSEFISKHDGDSRKSYWDYDEDTMYKANRREDNWEQNRYWNNSYDINEFRMREKEELEAVVEEKKSPIEEKAEEELPVEIQREDEGQNSQTASKLVSEYEEFMKTVGVELAAEAEVSNQSKIAKSSISDKSSVKSDKCSVKSDKSSIKSDKMSIKSDRLSVKSDKSSQKSEKTRKSKKKKKRKSSTSSDDTKSRKRKRRSKSKKKARKIKKAKKRRKKSTSSSSTSSSSSSSDLSSDETISTSTSSSNGSIMEPSQIKLEKLSDEEKEKEPPVIVNIKKEIIDETEAKKLSENPDYFNTFNLSNIENSSFEKLERQREEIVASLQVTEPPPPTVTISSTISLVLPQPEQKRPKEPTPERIPESKKSSYDHKKRLSPSEFDRYNDYKYRSSKDRSSSRRSDYSRRRYDDSKYYRSRRSRSPLNRPRDYASNSPLDGFKRSVADSTISDSELVQSINHEPPPPGIELYKKDRLSELKRTSSSSPSVDSPLSPKRLSLDDRINQFLGIEEKKPPQNPYYAYNSTENYYPEQRYYPEQQQYNVYPQDPNYYQPPPSRYPQQSQVLQVGNVLQVVPAEMPNYPQVPAPPVKKEEDCTKSKVVQVGNMLQIVPTETLPEPPKLKLVSPPKPKATPPQPKPLELPLPPIPPTPPPKKDIVQDYIRETNAILNIKAEDSKKATLVLVNEVVEKQRKMDKEKRHAEREERRKAREIKRAEKEKRRDQRIKVKTEKMIKRALLLDTPDNIDAAIIDISDLNDDDEGTTSTTTMWPPPCPLPICLDVPSKGILVKSGFSKLKSEFDFMDDLLSTPPEDKCRKTVRFADGIPPGEGTSPSGGEDLPSPPPPKRKLPKEERYKKTKMRQRKKVKVKVIRPVPVPIEPETEDSDDNLPPPPPPPGSPPPHLWPPNYNKPVEAPQFVPAAPFPPFPNGTISTHLPPPGFLPPPSPNTNMMIPPSPNTNLMIPPSPNTNIMVPPSPTPNMMVPPPSLLNTIITPPPNMKPPPVMNFRPPMPRFAPDGTISTPPPFNKMFLPDRRHYPIT